MTTSERFVDKYIPCKCGFSNDVEYRYSKCDCDNSKAKAELTKLIDEKVLAAENIMGERIIERQRQTFQWEKTESYINTYQDQKNNDIHGIDGRIQNQLNTNPTKKLDRSEDE